MKNKCRSKRGFFFIIPIIILFALTAIVMWLWNATLPNVIGVQAVTYWQSMGILVLSKILFGGFGGFRKHRDHRHKRHFFNKIKNMSPEEKENFKQQWRKRFHNKGFCKGAGNDKENEF